MRYTVLTDNINIYFQEIRKHSPLTKDDEEILFARIARGDERAVNEVFNRMAKMAVMVAKTYTNDPDFLQDLIQEANYGIIVAIRKFNPDLGFRFSTYARWWMKSKIEMCINEKDAVHSSNMTLTYKARKVREEFFKKYRRDITEYELMDELEQMGEVVTDLSAIVNVKMERMDVPTDDGDTMLDSGDVAMGTSNTNAFVDQMEEESLSDKITCLLARLTPREQTIVKMHFGIGYDYEMDYKTIAEKYNKINPDKPLTTERIRQICVGALKKMK